MAHGAGRALACPAHGATDRLARPRQLRPPPAPISDLRRRAPYYGYRLASVLANALPSPAARGLAAAAAQAAPKFMKERRLMVERHLTRTLGRPATDADVQQVFNSYARYWMESFRLPTTSAAELEANMSYEGVDHIERAFAAGNGAIAAMPHLGGWDYGGTFLASVGYPATVVVEALDPPELFEWFTSFRASLGLTVVPHGREAGTAVLRALRNNGLVGLVCDRDLDRNGVEVEFFGERTTLPAGPATLSLRTRAPILPTAVYFEGPSHRGVIEAPVEYERTGKLRDDVAGLTQALARRLEAMIRRAPDQWHVLQPNWPSDYDLIATRPSSH